MSCRDKPIIVAGPINRTLINIPVDELKIILAGNWLLKKERICGFPGCTTTTFLSGQEDVLSFLPLDSVKHVRANGVIVVYDKAIITKANNYDSSWVYSMHGGFVAWSFQKIQNDTLIMVRDGGGGSASYLIKKI